MSTASKRQQEAIDRLKDRERAFILDGVVVSRQANEEIDRNTPSLDFGIPQYNALNDPHCKNYFKSKSLPKKLKPLIKTKEIVSILEKKISQSLKMLHKKEASVTSTMQGERRDKWLARSEAVDYIEKRKTYGAGYDRSLHDGHLSLPNPKPITGYWGEDGYRRNTFDLRRRPSVFDDPDDESRLPPLKPNIRARTLSAPATLQSHRNKSARIYSAKVRVPPARVRVQSAAPRIGDSGRISRPQSGRPAPLKEEREEERETKDNEEDIPEE